MRKQTAAEIAGPREPALTTGEAAALLGTSRQHIVDLCNAGDLPFTTVGKHRRIRREDINALRDTSQRLNRDQLRSLFLSYAVAGILVADPEPTLDVARRNLRNMLAHSPRGSAQVWLQEWDSLLNGPLPDLLEALTSRTPRSRELRQNTPFAGLLPDTTRRKVLAALPPTRSHAHA